MSRQPVAVTAAIIRRGELVLVARRRADGARGGLWEFPGGKVEPGETDEAALARELNEELGIDACVGRPADTVTWEYPDVTIELRAYECEIVRGEPAPGEHEELAWLPAERLLELALAPADVPIATRLARRA